MSFRITGLDPEPFRPLFGLSEAALAAKGARRVPVEKPRSAPCRIGLRDAEPGGTVILVNYEHQPADTPFRATHAIFVSEKPDARFDAVDVVPPAFIGRTLSLRAFDRDHMMIDAALADGGDTAATLERLFGDAWVDYVQIHYATRGCYAARAERA
jgi:hypothetical protein